MCRIKEGAVRARPITCSSWSVRPGLARLACACLALAVLLPLLASCALFGPAAPQPTRVPRVGFLSPGDPETARDIVGFRQGLRELTKLVEGETAFIEPRFAERKDERFAELARELVALKVDVIVATATPAIQAAKEATSTIPIVMAPSGDPIVAGFVASLARPGGNITGLSMMDRQIGAKRLELLSEIVPGLSRVGVLWNVTNPVMAMVFQETQEAAQATGVQLVPLGVREADDLERAFETATRERVDALIVVGDPLTFANRSRIAALEVQHRIPAMYSTRDVVAAGGLVAYGPDRNDIWRRAAIYVEKILQGRDPAVLPVEQPTRFELVINLKTAQAIGITIPREILLMADDAIQ